MSNKNFVRSLVSNKIYQRGINYYNIGRVLQYRIKKKEPNHYQISARVSGTKKYQVNTDIKLKREGIDVESSCDCPYDWEEFCKHEVAVLHKFMEEDFRSSKVEYEPAAEQVRATSDSEPDFSKKKAGPDIVKQRLADRSFKNLKEIAKNYDENEIPKLRYSVKGLLNTNLVNFKLIFDSDYLSQRELEEVVNSINEDGSYAYYKESLLHKYFYGKELKLLEDLSDLLKSKGRGSSLLLSKNEKNLDFLLNLSQIFKLQLEENGSYVKKGKTLRPELKLEGDLNGIEITLKEEDYPIYQGGEKDCRWTVIENTVHKIDFYDFDKLPTSFMIPEQHQGEFLFEILPTLEKNLKLERSAELEGFELIKESPSIDLNLDYRQQKISCQLEVEFAGETYSNTELLGLDTEQNIYKRDSENPKLWYGRDNKALAEVINFLEDYNFKVKPEHFIIKDNNEIQEFITDGMTHIPEDWNVERSESFDQIEIKEVKLEPIIEIDDSEGINWFDFSISYNLGGKTYSRQELQQLISYNKKGEAYVKLENHYYILESGAQEEKIEQMLKDAEAQAEGYRAPYHNLLYYKNLVEKSGINFRGNKVFNELEAEISGLNVVKEREIPVEVKGKLRDYQKNGYNWLRFLHKYRFGGILADDMGLGKTLQMLTLLKSLEPEKAALVLCPRTLIYNWQEEAAKFFDDLKTLVYYGTPAEREAMRGDFNQYDLIISSYSTIARDVEDLNAENIIFSFAILDEAQHIKNHRTKRAKAVKNIQAETRLALTGTPLENSVEELWSIFDFLMPGYLGNYSYFKQNFLNPINKNNEQEKMRELKERVAPFILRRRKGDVLKELPEKIVNIHPVSMTQLQEDSYQAVLEEVRGELEQTVEDQGFNRSRINVLAALTKLRQICNHPSLVLGEEGRAHNSGKLEALRELISDALSGGHKIIVFSQFVKMLKLIRADFEQQGINYLYLDGSTRKRMEKVREFNSNPEVEVFLISLKAGGVGLNLTAADMVVHVDPWWNPMVERQATDRAHRLGQENRVMVYKLITRGTVEEKMLKLQQRKQNLFDNIIENNVNPIKAISWEDIQDLLSY
ncbi:SNF2-related protein [Halanaerobium congolense]|jgi:SNF2 family DNA or RNA helicase|uniref:Helicase conserved C-terminal domain-containing protein n=1 Tax=Halanaerobium congolense TaxID=54121 RepID=A0A1G6RHF8_9FIRM|nr:SNF2-related protein [Halanaerobium congolense]OEG63447.1 MAG: helicase SNF2 [Halanaerobium sp. MDAL1]SDD04089.1 Helicase conserved C-terminal domain-containing protein [Halanaerobium congolense]